jgi:hypothetical protein
MTANADGGDEVAQSAGAAVGAEGEKHEEDERADLTPPTTAPLAWD